MVRPIARQARDAMSPLARRFARPSGKLVQMYVLGIGFRGTQFFNIKAT